MLKFCDIWLKEAATLTPSSTSPSKQMQWKTSAGGRSGYVCGAAGAYVCVAVCVWVCVCVCSGACVCVSARACCGVYKRERDREREIG